MGAHDLTNYTIEMNATLLQTAKVISSNRARCVIVVDGGKAIGVLSEGDILRALIDDANTHAPINGFVNHNFKMLKSRDMDQAASFVREYGITLIPVVDDNVILTDVITLQDVMDHYQ